MPTATGAILVGYDNTDRWGSIERRPTFTLYKIEYGAPVLADETATFQNEWGAPHSMILRADPADVAYDIAYMVLDHLVPADPHIETTWPPKSLEDWPNDPRTHNGRGFALRTRLHPAIEAEVKATPRIRLQVVEFHRLSPLQEAIAAEIAASPDIRPGLVTFGEAFGTSTPAVLRRLGFAVETYTRDLEPGEFPEVNAS